MDVGLFEAHYEGDGLPCPACGAAWVKASASERKRGVVMTMDHARGCAYLAWLDAEHRAWMEY